MGSLSRTGNRKSRAVHEVRSATKRPDCVRTRVLLSDGRNKASAEKQYANSGPFPGQSDYAVSTR